MNKKYRLYGMLICLLILAFSSWLLSMDNQIVVLLTMFVGGYALRETLDKVGEERQNERKRILPLLRHNN